MLDDLLSASKWIIKHPIKSRGIALGIIGAVIAAETWLINRKPQTPIQKLSSYSLHKLPISPKSNYTDNYDRVVIVGMGEYAIVTSKSGDKKIAYTYGLGPCFGLTLYDEVNQVAAVAHIDPDTDIQASIDDIMTNLINAGGKKYEARLFGGNRRSAKEIVDLIEALRSYEVKIVEGDIVENVQSRSIGISVNGTLYGEEFFLNKGLKIGNRMDAGVGFYFGRPMKLISKNK